MHAVNLQEMGDHVNHWKCSALQEILGKESELVEKIAEV